MLKLSTPVLAVAVLALFSSADLRAAAPAAAGEPADLVKPSLVADAEAVAPGQSFTLGLKMQIKPHWHTYWANPGETGEATTIKLTGPKGFEFGDIQWPLPKKILMDGSITYGYEDEVLLMVPVKVGKDVKPGASATIDADVNWLSCKETCIPGQAKLSITLPVAEKAKPANEALFANWKGQLPAAREAAGSAVARVEQPRAADGAPASILLVDWKQPPKSVDWYPLATRAVGIENVAVKHDGTKTQITFEPTVFQADELPQGRVEGVLVYEGADGKRVGVVTPFFVKAGE